MNNGFGFNLYCVIDISQIGWAAEWIPCGLSQCIPKGKLEFPSDLLTMIKADVTATKKTKFLEWSTEYVVSHIEATMIVIDLIDETGTITDRLGVKVEEDDDWNATATLMYSTTDLDLLDQAYLVSRSWNVVSGTRPMDSFEAECLIGLNKLVEVGAITDEQMADMIDGFLREDALSEDKWRDAGSPGPKWSEADFDPATLMHVCNDCGQPSHRKDGEGCPFCAG